MGPPRSRSLVVVARPSSLANAGTHTSRLIASMAMSHRAGTERLHQHKDATTAARPALCLYHICVIDLGTSNNIRNLTFLAEFSFIVIQYVRRKGDDMYPR